MGSRFKLVSDFEACPGAPGFALSSFRACRGDGSAGGDEAQTILQQLEMKTDLTALKARLAQLAELADARKPVQSRVLRSIAQPPAEAPAE